jgi:hypothetical protein
MAIRIMADAMILEIDNRVGEHAGADGKWGMDQVGPGEGANVCSNTVLGLVQRPPRSE